MKKLIFLTLLFILLLAMSLAAAGPGKVRDSAHPGPRRADYQPMNQGGRP